MSEREDKRASERMSTTHTIVTKYHAARVSHQTAIATINRGEHREQDHIRFVQSLEYTTFCVSDGSGLARIPSRIHQCCCSASAHNSATNTITTTHVDGDEVGVGPLAVEEVQLLLLGGREGLGGVVPLAPGGHHEVPAASSRADRKQLLC